jgi:phosphoribosylamine--glycine ligase
VIEERLEGREASVIAICDGTRAVALPAARDYKRLCDDDQGPNTGGMGAHSPLFDLDEGAIERVLETVHRPILAEMDRRGRSFRGFLYAGLILTAEGPVLLECNVRLGDPEAQVILPRISVPLGTILLAAAKGRLPESLPAIVPTTAGAVVGIVLASKGYPGQPKRGDPIVGLDEATADGALVFHAGTIGRPQGGFGTSGGRVLTVVGRGRTPDDARRQAERGADAISWEGMQRRHDIGSDAAQPAALAGAAR